MKDFVQMELIVSMSSQEVSRVKTSRQQVNGQAYMAAGRAYGVNSLELCAKYDPNTQSLRMLQGCLLESREGGSTDYCATWPRAGSFWNGNVYQHPASALRTTEIGCTVLPTPVKSDGSAFSLKQTLRLKETWENIPGLTGLVVARVLGLIGKQKHDKKYLVNPLLLEKMMGFPDGWTEIPDSETP